MNNYNLKLNKTIHQSVNKEYIWYSSKARISAQRYRCDLFQEWISSNKRTNICVTRYWCIICTSLKNLNTWEKRIHADGSFIIISLKFSQFYAANTVCPEWFEANIHIPQQRLILKRFLQEYPWILSCWTQIPDYTSTTPHDFTSDVNALNSPSTNSTDSILLQTT